MITGTGSPGDLVGTVGGSRGYPNACILSPLGAASATELYRVSSATIAVTFGFSCSHSSVVQWHCWIVLVRRTAAVVSERRVGPKGWTVPWRGITRDNPIACARVPLFPSCIRLKLNKKLPSQPQVFFFDAKQRKSDAKSPRRKKQTIEVSRLYYKSAHLSYHTIKSLRANCGRPINCDPTHRFRNVRRANTKEYLPR